MEKDNIEQLFENLKGSFDTQAPEYGHEDRFLEKMNLGSKGGTSPIKKTAWWKGVSIAASVAVLIAVSIGFFNQNSSIEQQVAKVSPEVSNSQFYFASLIEEQVKELQAESSPETQKIIFDTMLQLKTLETDYGRLEKELLSGGNSKLLLSAMITNFQTRIDLLHDVLEQIETIKNLKNYNDANYTL
ncbi:MAG: hypothetical protein ACJAU2_001601 [Maribacter sp.]|jgi:hypothetical protein